MATLTYLQAIILGLVQGLAEFLPVSSSGHLALLQYFFGIKGDSVLMFTVMLHMGTLISVFVIYWRDIIKLLWELCRTVKDICTGKGPRINITETRRLGFLIIAATIPTAVMGLLFNNTFEKFYSSLTVIGIGLLITGTILWIADHMRSNTKLIPQTKFRYAFFIGIMQGIAITPGISRSGSTLFGGLVSGLDRAYAVKLAFLISIPSILGSFIMEMPDAAKAGVQPGTMGPMIVGVVVAAVSGFVAIKAMIKIVSGKKLSIFSFYTWAVGAFVVIYALFIA